MMELTWRCGSGIMAVFTSLIVIIIIFLLYRVLKFIRADADLNLLRHSLNPAFFKDKVVWVTGASSGIGEELCHQLSKNGAKLILSARSKDKLTSVLESLAHPENSRVFLLDMTDRDSVRNAPQQVKSLFGRVDILINNAGVSMRSTFLDMEEDAARKLVEVDLMGPSFLTKGVIKSIMLEQGEGHVVNVSSVSGKFGSPVRSYYSAAKFGLIGLMDSLRLEVLDNNIHITNVCPGPVKTTVSENALNSHGTSYGKKDNLIENGMKVERCVELIMIGISNRLREIWIADQPVLLATYLSQYAPFLFYFILKKRVQSAVAEVQT